MTSLPGCFRVLRNDPDRRLIVLAVFDRRRGILGMGGRSLPRRSPRIHTRPRSPGRTRRRSRSGPGYWQCKRYISGSEDQPAPCDQVRNIPPHHPSSRRKGCPRNDPTRFLSVRDSGRRQPDRSGSRRAWRSVCRFTAPEEGDRRLFETLTRLSQLDARNSSFVRHRQGTTRRVGEYPRAGGIV